MVFVQARRLFSGVEWRPLELILVLWMDKRWTRRVADRQTDVRSETKSCS